jgi:integrase/recombinase XerD
MTLLFLTCGLRLSELAQIDIDAIKVDSLNVIGKGNKERTIFLTNSVLEAIRDCKKHRPETEDPALFLSTHKQRMTNRAIQYRIDKHLAEAGFDTKLYSTHKLRHTAATLLYKHGKVDIRTLQELLGHESIATTQIYTHTDDEQLREAIAKNPLADLS